MSRTQGYYAKFEVPHVYFTMNQVFQAGASGKVNGFVRMLSFISLHLDGLLSSDFMLSNLLLFFFQLL